MGQKDLTQKNLEYYPDVFADIMNALLYEGKQVVQPAELQPAPTETIYHSKKGNLRNQFHDVSKYEMREGIIRLQYTIENETNSNNKLVFRKVGYAGAVYREQYDRKNKKMYPFISLVLYWGKRKNSIRKSIHSLFSAELPEETMRYIDDAKLYIYDMRNLPKDARQRFHSDMRIIVDYLAEGGEYRPTNQVIVHIEEFLLLMQALTGDNRYEQILPQLEKKEKQGGITMCELLNKYENRGIQKGIKKGEKRGTQKGIKALVKICQEFGLSQADTIARVIQEFTLSQDEGTKWTQKYWIA